jgi:anti-sigma-K factor RskA
VAAVASLAVAAAAVVVALALIAGGEESAPQEDAPPDPRPLVGQQLELSSDTNWDRWGSAVVARRGSLTVEANLKPAGRGREYEVWLSNNRLDARSLGTFDVRPGDDALVKVDLPERGLSGYEWLEITLEPEPTDEKHSGKTLLKGRVAELTGG